MFVVVLEPEEEEAAEREAAAEEERRKAETPSDIEVTAPFTPSCRSYLLPI